LFLFVLQVRQLNVPGSELYRKLRQLKGHVRLSPCIHAACIC
jgi:hypothetical protein